MFENIAIPGDFQLSSGRKSNVFYDFHRMNPSEMKDHCHTLATQIEENKESRYSFDFIVAPATGGVVPGFQIAYHFDKFLFILEKGNEVKPYVPTTGNYLIVDDVVTSFGTIDRTMAAMPDAKCVGIASFIFRGSKEDLEGHVQLRNPHDRMKGLPWFTCLATKETEKI